MENSHSTYFQDLEDDSVLYTFSTLKEAKRKNSIVTYPVDIITTSLIISPFRLPKKQPKRGLPKKIEIKLYKEMSYRWTRM